MDLCDLSEFGLHHLVRLSFVVVVVVVAAVVVVVVVRVAPVAVSNVRWPDVPTCENPSKKIESQAKARMTTASSAGTSTVESSRRTSTSGCLGTIA